MTVVWVVVTALFIGLVLMVLEGVLGAWWWWVVVVALGVVALTARALLDSEIDDAESDLSPGVPIDTSRWRTRDPERSDTPPVTGRPGHQRPMPPESRQPVATLRPGGAVQDAAFHPGRPCLAQGLAGGDVVLWDVTTVAEPRCTARLHPARSRGGDDFAATAVAPGRTALAFSPSGDLLAAGGSGVLWDLTPSAGPREAARLTGPGQVGDVAAVAFSPDGRLLAVSRDGGRCVVLWDVATPTAPRELVVLAQQPRRGSFGKRVNRPQPGGEPSSARVPTALVFHPTAPLLAATAYDAKGTQAVRLWDLANPSRPEHSGALTPYRSWSANFIPAIHDLAMDSSGGLLAIASEATGIYTSQYGSTSWREAEVGLWAIAGPSRLRRLFGLREIGTLRESRRSLSGFGHRRGDYRRRTRTGHRALARAVAFHPRRPLLATAGADTTTLLWEVADTGALCLVEVIDDHRNALTVAFDSRDGLLAVTSDRDTKLWTVG